MKFSLRTLFNYKEIKTGVLFALVGLFFAAIGVVFMIQTNQEGYIKKEAEISKIETDYSYEDTRYTVWVKYEVQGIEYNTVLGSYDASMYEGKTIEIFYNPQNPNQIYTQSTVLFIFIIAFGGLFAVIGIFSIVKVIKQIGAEKELKEREEARGTANQPRPTAESLLAQSTDWRKYHFEPNFSEPKSFLFDLTNEDGTLVGDVRIPRIQTILGNTAEFTNHIKRQTTSHKFGMETETNDRTALGIVTNALHTNKTWTFDGIDSVLYLRRLGIRVFLQKADQIGLGALVKYAITLDGNPFAVVEPTPFKGPASTLALLGTMPNGYCFDIQCAEKDMDTVLIVAFALLKGCNIFE